MLYAIVMLTLTVSDCDNGITLFEVTRPMAEFSVSGNRVNDCLKVGVKQAHALTGHYKNDEHPNVSTNVKCWLKYLPGQPA